MKKDLPAIKAECVRLRLEGRLSLREIADRTGAAKGSLSLWLKEYPLSDHEKAELRSRPRVSKRPKKFQATESSWHKLVGYNLSTHRKGKIAEAAVLFRLVLHGHEVYGSPFDGDKADWVVSAAGSSRLLRLQVRWCRLNQQGMPFISLHCADGRSSQRRYTDDECDIMVGYCLYNDTAYVYTHPEIRHIKQAVAVSLDAAERWDKIG